MNNSQKLETNTNTADQQPKKRPNEQVGFYFSSSLKITDPNTGKVLVQMRAD